jgi:hypothetical protein
MRIISYDEKFTSTEHRVHYRNARWYKKPEPNYDRVVAKEEKIIQDYLSMGVKEYTEEVVAPVEAVEEIIEEVIVEEVKDPPKSRRKKGDE